MTRWILVAGLCLTGCSTWAQVHGPTFGVAVEFDDEWNVSPRLQLGYSFDRWTGLLTGFGGGGGISISLLSSRFELYGEVRGFGFPVPVIAVGPVLAYDPVLGGSVGFRAGGSLWPSTFFYPPEYCTMGVWEQTRDEPCPPTEYTANDVMHPIWLPHVGYRLTVLWPFSGEEEKLVHQAFFDATIAGFRLWGGAPGPILDYGER